MMNKLVIIFIAIICLTASCGKSNRCEKFREGEFSYKDEPFSAITIIRTATEQTEHETRTGLKARFDIHWIDDCEYELIQTWSNDSVFSLSNGTKISAKIKTINDNTYEYDAVSQGMKTRNTIIKIK